MTVRAATAWVCCWTTTRSWHDEKQERKNEMEKQTWNWSCLNFQTLVTGLYRMFIKEIGVCSICGMSCEGRCDSWRTWYMGLQNDGPSILKEELRLEADRATWDPVGFTLAGNRQGIRSYERWPSNFPTKQGGIIASFGCCHCLPVFLHSSTHVTLLCRLAGGKRWASNLSVEAE